MPKTALVLNGCGAKGAFQLMAEKYAREKKGYTWDIIAGVSVGALNGVLLAMGKHEWLEQIWRELTPARVFGRKPGFWPYITLLFGSKSIYSHGPLWRLIDREVDPAKIKVPIRIYSVSLASGLSRCFSPDDPHFKQAVLASTSIPIIWPPVNIGPGLMCMVDGAVRNISPFGDVLDFEPDELVIIDCSPAEPPVLSCPARNVLEIGRRSLELAAHEIFLTDCTAMLRINSMVEQAAGRGITLHNEKGKPFKYYRSVVIAPTEPLDDALDFSPRAIARSMEAGWERAKQVLG